MLYPLAETTECDFKRELETKKPKSWLKSLSAFANGIGRKLIFGIDDSGEIVGIIDAQKSAEAISDLIKTRITPTPQFILTLEKEQEKSVLILTIEAGRATPYYYKADGIREAYVRIGNESIVAPDYILNELIFNFIRPEIFANIFCNFLFSLISIIIWRNILICDICLHIWIVISFIDSLKDTHVIIKIFESECL